MSAPVEPRLETWDHYLARSDDDITGWREQREERLGYYYPNPATSGVLLYQEAS